ncbi:hypothetical protein ACQUSR_32605 [Streptomyces sp. P1-3]|uniref:hypothetical protein n=1 Tax=Streptomyces sp. P1-3 TaxID=3421658 RepID=UPI003D35B410
MRITALVLAHGAAEVRVHLVTGAAPGTAVRQTGWAVAPGGPGSELLPVHGLTAGPAAPAADTAFAARAVAPVLTGEMVAGGESGDLFVCLARLSGERDPAPLHALADVAVRRAADGAYEVTVGWADGPTHRARLTPEAVRVNGCLDQGLSA